MRASLFTVAAIAGYPAASLAFEVVDFASIEAATFTGFTAPPLTTHTQTVTYRPDTAKANDITAVAEPPVSVIESSSAMSAMRKRDGEEVSDSTKNDKKTSSSSTRSSSSGSIARTSASSTKSPSSSLKTSVTRTSSAAAAPTAAAPTTAATPTAAAPSSDAAAPSSGSTCPTTPGVNGECVTTDPSRDCAPEPDGYGPVPDDRTIEGFYAYQPFHDTANAAITPAGYDRTFVDLNSATSANSYLGLWTLQSYDTALCAQYCDQTTTCQSFNIYIERGPSLNPTLDTCLQPTPLTNYKCTLWGSVIDAASATNQGGWRNQFQVVITGSNGYSKAVRPTYEPEGIDGWKKPVNLKNRAVDMPMQRLGSKFFPGPYDPKVCAKYAVAQSKYNRKKRTSKSGGRYTPVNSFNAFYMKRDGFGLGTWCSIFTTQVWSGRNTYKGGKSKEGKDYTCESSFAYERQNLDWGNYAD